MPAMNCALLLFLVLVAPPKAVPARVTSIDISRSSNSLTLAFDDGHKEQFRVSLGRAGNNCTRKAKGDSCTPEGRFFIAAKRPSSRFHKFLLLSYPDEDLAAKTLKAGQITPREFQLITTALKEHRAPPQDTPLGGDIGIHGQPAWVPGFLQSFVKKINWTAACVSVTNSEIDHIYELTDVGTPVVIHN